MKTTTTIIAAIAIFFAIGIAGNYERAEEIIYSMSDEVYEQVKSNLPHDASSLEIADEYMAHREYYDTIQ